MNGVEHFLHIPCRITGVLNTSCTFRHADAPSVNAPSSLRIVVSPVSDVHVLLAISLGDPMHTRSS